MQDTTRTRKAVGFATKMTLLALLSLAAPANPAVVPAVQCAGLSSAFWAEMSKSDDNALRKWPNSPGALAGQSQQFWENQSCSPPRQSTSRAIAEGMRGISALHHAHNAVRALSTSFLGPAWYISVLKRLNTLCSYCARSGGGKRSALFYDLHAHQQAPFCGAGLV